MDQSLDDYITKKNKPGFPKTARLGQKISPGRANVIAAQRNVTGLQRRNPLQNRTGLASSIRGTITGPPADKRFDARQKITQRDKQLHVQDARQKLAQKKKFSNVGSNLQIRTAGVPNKLQPTKNFGAASMHVQVRNNGPTQTKGKIQIRRPITAPGALDGNPSKLDAQDMRIKIQNAKAKSMDARDKIRARQNAKAAIKQVITSPDKTPSSGHTTVTLAGFGEGTGNSQAKDHSQATFQPGINLRKTIQTDQEDDQDIDVDPHVVPPQKDLSLKKTIQNSAAIPTTTNRVGNNIVISPSATGHSGQPFPSQPQPQIYQNVQQPTPTHYPQVQITQPVYAEPHYSSQQQYTQPHYAQPQPQQYSQPAPVQQQFHHEPMAMIRVKNDDFRSPQAAAPHVPVVNPDLDFPPSSSYIERDNTVSRPLRASVTRPSQAVSTKPVLQARLGGIATDEDLPDMSPLQGYRLMITNLHSVVTQDDIVELFGAAGALRKAKLLRAGTAEVVYIKREEALAAVHKYHNRELDGQPMKVVMMTSNTSVPKPSTDDASSMLPRFQKSSGSHADIAGDVDIGLLHKALFKTTSKDDPPARPVAFTVKI